MLVSHNNTGQFWRDETKLDQIYLLEREISTFKTYDLKFI